MASVRPTSPEPQWASRPAPARLGLVQQFVNTHAFSGRTDQLATLSSARPWLGAHGYEVAALTGRRLRNLTALREALRRELLGHVGHGHPAGVAAAVRQELGAPQLTVAYGADGAVTIVGAGAGVARLVNDLAAARAVAGLTGEWARLKVCGNDECLVAFWDHTKNGSARFCSAAACANRARQRAFRHRHRGD